MLAIFLVTVFSCLLGAANAGNIANGSPCNAPTDCADPNTVCSSNCVCKGGYTEYMGKCAITHGTAGGTCLTSGSACTGDTLVCESTVCKIKADKNCPASSTNCVSHSTCSTTCKCDAGYTALATGLCIAEHTIGATCALTDGSKGDCLDSNAICPATSKKCECKPGYTGTTGGSCAAKNEGSAPGQLSMWMLCMTIMTMSLAAYVV